MIPIYQPDLSGNEREYLIDAFDSSWISSKGAYIDKFERAFSEATGIPHAGTVSNGTVALHLAMHCLDFSPGDEVIVPSFTYIASINTIVQAGAKPVFVDVSRSDWLMDPEKVEQSITPRTCAIMAVHLFGAVCDMERLKEIAQKYDLWLIEDCAEALGSRYKGRHVGSFGDVATFSFFGNKTITTGEGGMVATADPDLFRRMLTVKGQGQSPDRRYWHVELGFNYRMTNLCAAIGLAQLERLPHLLNRKQAVAKDYRRKLAGSGVEFQKLSDDVVSSEWLISLLLPKFVNRDDVMSSLAEAGIETRPVFYCAHQMPPYYDPHLALPVSQDIADRGISIPSYPSLMQTDIDHVCDSLLQSLLLQASLATSVDK